MRNDGVSVGQLDLCGRCAFVLGAGHTESRGSSLKEYIGRWV